MIRLIWAQEHTGGIGKDGGLPWKCKAGMQHFAKLTKGATVVMGRKTWDSLPFKSGLPGRRNIVLPRNADFVGTETMTVSEVRALEEDVWVIGGGEVYHAFFNYAEEFHISLILGAYDCDTKAPQYPLSDGVTLYWFKPDA